MIDVTDLRLSFGDTEVLHGITCQVAEREVVCIIGASGSGKSTLLRCMNGLETPSHGTIAINGHRLGPHEARANLAAVRRDVGMVFQQFNLFPHLTVEENVTLAPRKVVGLPREAARSRARVLLEKVGLAGKVDAYPGSLSGGQAQRVAIARAQVTGASVVFADEPTGALDSQTSADVMRALLDSTTGQGRTLVVVTHDAEVAGRCSRIVDMRDGRIVGERAGERVAA